MASFNSWEDERNYNLVQDATVEYNFKIHGSKYLTTDVLKDAIGFDGLVVSDWNGHAEISGLSILAKSVQAVPHIVKRHSSC